MNLIKINGFTWAIKSHFHRGVGQTRVSLRERENVATMFEGELMSNQKLYLSESWGVFQEFFSARVSWQSKMVVGATAGGYSWCDWLRVCLKLKGIMFFSHYVSGWRLGVESVTTVRQVCVSPYRYIVFMQIKQNKLKWTNTFLWLNLLLY